MGFYTVIYANADQAKMLYDKHMKPREANFFEKLFGAQEISVLSNFHFSYDSEDSIGFFSCETDSGKKISCQLRGSYPCFVQFTGFGDIRYDIAYPDQLNTEMHELLKKCANECKDNFWKGGQI